ncbi:hypothetical protein RRG08_016506 [Elysia crispata]|uniref:Uncharacterized protein n=1 Tax=Elysia crispata TaxID=231223 RepID=A0AAE0Y9S5_9GAST|nr:hypothetical protein RRG08_016506 [Elysia crispata]
MGEPVRSRPCPRPHQVVALSVGTIPWGRAKFSLTWAASSRSLDLAGVDPPGGCGWMVTLCLAAWCYRRTEGRRPTSG